jgi:hypothetical protein
LVKKWIPLSRSEIAEIGQKTKGILGVKMNKSINWILSPFQEESNAVKYVFFEINYEFFVEVFIIASPKCK